MIGGEKYRPGRAMVGEPTPQSDPELFSDAEILAEVKYLLKLNEKYGTHILRVEAYLKLTQFIRDRNSANA